ncbi:hypothetical protein [Plantactinospora soyae]|uniref:Uncharacterized protein n=1 Tax=Plantactinospora soyae TaxID=1544732 RepID=A0A927RAZ4_9ACTN|nr:hypothetical protein [Plantactinospora soyae]MBE1492839.1 hypothetical protein [Plantactinospora soyae]
MYRADLRSRPERRIVAAVRELAESGVRARIGAVPVGAGPVHSQLPETDPAATRFGATGDPEPLVVATDGSAHLLVRTPRTDVRDEPREWVRQLVAPEVAAPQGVGGAGPV